MFELTRLNRVNLVRAGSNGQRSQQQSTPGQHEEPVTKLECSELEYYRCTLANPLSWNDITESR
ncbi:hypothetical protein Hanom_Chr12g01150141 [Helianthus anomalus]